MSKSWVRIPPRPQIKIKDRYELLKSKSKHTPQQLPKLRHAHHGNSLPAHHILSIHGTLFHFADKSPQAFLDGVVYLKPLAAVKHVCQTVGVTRSYIP